jgi:hypothetical protein
MRKAFLFVILTVFVASIAFAQTKPRTVVPTGKFKIQGSVVVEYQPNTTDGSFSLDVFRQENKRLLLSKKINDENFAEASPSACPGGKKRIYLVRPIERRGALVVYTTTEALEFIQAQDGERPTLALALMLQKQRGPIWQQQTVIFTERSVPSKDEAVTLIPSVDTDGNISLVSQEYPWENHDFIFMVDEPEVEESAILSER